MNNGKITIESGKYKAIFNISEDENGELKTKVDFEPELDLKQEKSNEVNFILNVANILISGLRGD